MASGGAVVLLLLLGLAVPVVIWLLIESETADERVVDRADAERQVRTDHGRDGDQDEGRR